MIHEWHLTLCFLALADKADGKSIDQPVILDTSEKPQRKLSLDVSLVAITNLNKVRFAFVCILLAFAAFDSEASIVLPELSFITFHFVQVAGSNSSSPGNSAPSSPVGFHIARDLFPISKATPPLTVRCTLRFVTACGRWHRWTRLCGGW